MKKTPKGQHTSCLEKERYGMTIINTDILHTHIHTHSKSFDFIDISIIIKYEAICQFNTRNYSQTCLYMS